MDEQKIKDEVKQALSKLQGLRDDIRVRLHLAELDIKKQWDALDPQVAEAEKMAHQASDTVRDKLHELVGKLDSLRASLGAK